MTIKTIKTSISRPPRLVIYGEHKIGKSTFASTCPAPIFIQTEDGLDSLSVDAFPYCKTYQAVIDALDQLLTQGHSFRTVVIDSLDWTERLIWESICAEHSWKQIGDGAFGAGYKLAINRWRDIVAKLQRLNEERRMIICLIAHAKITRFDDPEREGYNVYTLDMHEKSSQLLLQWVDIIGFYNFKITTIESKEGFGAKSVKAKGGSERVLNLTPKASFEAGNRYGLPAQVDPNWPAIYAELTKIFSARKSVEESGNLNEVKIDREIKGK